MVKGSNAKLLAKTGNTNSGYYYFYIIRELSKDLQRKKKQQHNSLLEEEYSHNYGTAKFSFLFTLQTYSLRFSLTGERCLQYNRTLS
jgi:hypothetical protein